MKRRLFYLWKLFQVPNHIPCHPVDILHGGQGCDLIFVVAAVGNAPQIPGKVLARLQAGDLLALVGGRHLKLAHGGVAPLAEGRTLGDGFTRKGGLCLLEDPGVAESIPW